MLDASQVSAVLITRGDQPDMINRIIETLPYDEIIVYDNSRRPNHRIASRYIAAMEAKHDVIYSQDDDCLFLEHDALMSEYEDGVTTAVYGHGDNEGGYGDLPLPCGGILFNRHQCWAAWEQVREACADLPDHETESYADFGVGVLVPFKQLPLPFEINMQIAQGPERLCNQPGAYDWKARVVARARAVRDARMFSGNVRVAETTYTPGEFVLDAINGAADSEFPRVATIPRSRA